MLKLISTFILFFQFHAFAGQDKAMRMMMLNNQIMQIEQSLQGQLAERQKLQIETTEVTELANKRERMNKLDQSIQNLNKAKIKLTAEAQRR